MALLSSVIGTSQFNSKLFKPGAILWSVKIIYYSTTYSHIHSTEPSTSSPDNSKDVVDSLISIFTKQPLTPNHPRLNQLAPRITTQVVESVLKGLKSWKIAQMFFKWTSINHGYKHNCYTYNAMASILSEAHQIDPLKVLLKDILNSQCSFTPGAFGFLIRCLGSVGLVQEASELFDEISLMGLCLPNIYSYNCLLEVIAKSGSIDMMEMRLKEMNQLGWQFDKHTLTPIMKTYCNNGRLEEALNIYDRMHESGWVDAHIYSMLIVSFSKCGKVDKAFELLERMESLDIKLNEKTFCILIHGFVKESRVDKALQLLSKMRKAGYIAAVSVYDALIGELCKNKETDKALYLYSEMKKLNIQPDVGVLIKLLSCSSEQSIIMKLLEEIPGDVNNETVLLLYNAALNGYSSDGLMDEACLLLQTMICNNNLPFKVKRVFPNSTSFSIVIDGLLKKGRLDLALGLLNDMQRIDCKPNILIYNNLINELCKVDRLDESLKLLKEMNDSGVEPTHFTYNSIYGCFCQRKDVLGAITILRVMRACGHAPWIKYTTLLVKELCAHNSSLEACDFLSTMVQIGFLPDIVSYTAAIQGLINIHEVDKALGLFRDLCSRGYCPDLVAFNILINGLCKLNKLAEVEVLLNEISKRDLSPSVATYNMLIDRNCKSGYIDEAMRLFSRMPREGREPNVITYTTLMDGLCKAGKPDDALMVWNEMGRKGCSPNKIAFMALIHGLCNCGRSTAALQYFREMKQKKLVADQYIHIALLSALLSDQNFPAAFEILTDIVERGLFPQSQDESYLIVRDAVHKLFMDEATSSDVQALIEKGRIPTSCFSIGNDGIP